MDMTTEQRAEFLSRFMAGETITAIWEDLYLVAPGAEDPQRLETWLREEIATLRASSRKLHARARAAEVVAREKIEEIYDKQPSRSLGRALANAACDVMHGELIRLRKIAHYWRCPVVLADDRFNR